MTEQNHLCRVWDIIEKVDVCMLTTQFAGGLCARPIEARIDRDAGLIFFVTDVHSAKHDEIDTAPNVGLVFIDPFMANCSSLASRLLSRQWLDICAAASCPHLKAGARF